MRIGFRQCIVAGALLAFLAAGAEAAPDLFIYWTNFGGNSINQYDLTTHTNKVIDNTPAGIGQPDSLIFDGAGNLYYTEFTRNCCSSVAGSVRMLNSTFTTDTQLATGFSHEAVDLALDPSGLSILLSDRNDEGNLAGHLQRILLSTGAVTTLAGVNTVDGIAYDGNRLFANVTSQDNQKVVELDPVTGAIINPGDLSFNSARFLDGLTYDPFSNLLYAANGHCMQTFDPTTLKAGACVGSFNSIDGLETDGNGNIIVADVGAGAVGNYNIATNTSTILFSAPGLDDIAPVFGAGAPPPPPPTVPEPASLTLLASALVGVGLLGLHKRQN